MRTQRRKTRKVKVEQGVQRTPSPKRDDWTLHRFKPSLKQKLIAESIEEKDLTIVQGTSGTGKTTTALWKCLTLYKSGAYQHIFLIKNPTEQGDDKLGYLTGDKDEKLASHMHSSKTVMYQFMSKARLENDTKNENIIFDIPNYLQGRTIDNSLVIVDEAQQMSPGTLKLVIERAGKNTKVVVLGDDEQCYAVKKRDNGLSDLIKRVTLDHQGIRLSKFPQIGFVRLNPEDNQRSSLSGLITKLYQE